MHPPVPSSQMTSDCSRALELMKEKIEVLEHQVETFRVQLRHEKSERESFQIQVGKRLRNILGEFNIREVEHAVLQDEHMRDFGEVSALLDATDSSVNSVSSTAQRTPTATTPKEDNSYLADAIENEQKLTFAGLTDLSSATNQDPNSNLNTRITTPYPQNVLSSLILKDYEQNSNAEDITSLINDAMAQNLEKRTLSNDFLLAQPQRARTGNGTVDATQSFGFTPNSSTRQIPLLPLRLNTPATPNLRPSGGPSSPASQLGERDILEKWGIRFSEKYTTISEVWNEYHRIGSKGVSIRSLERSFSTRWRSNLRKNVKKKYSRRLIIIRAIETGIKKGRTIDECIAILETFLTEAKKPVSHLYRKANLPAELT
ncbi:LANO_0H20274g1_1 [Lachancea nothofagi CBS 11611]|uniref:LANO_0H20274g1_1 n=1 Tax=Lachancea nothofagi CBS 11611 TaxID=1266666 RepID=A0A1G4KNM9_9SACH|nr:LANO_0H20274g1_1 [Lachancea nothofagi CBS 11611]